MKIILLYSDYVTLWIATCYNNKLAFGGYVVLVYKFILLSVQLDLALQLGKIFIVSKEEDAEEKILVRIYYAFNP